MRRPRPARLAGLAGIVLAAVVATTGSVLAGGPTDPPPPSSTGTVGAFRFAGSKDKPSATCFYGDPEGTANNNFLSRMTVAAPRVKAATGRSSQKVAWRLVVQAWKYTTDTWSVYARTPWTSATATPTAAAPLAKRSSRLRTYDDVDLGAWRAKAEIRWYARDGSRITGRGSVWVTWYLVHERELPTYTWQVPDCNWTTG